MNNVIANLLLRLDPSLRPFFRPLVGGAAKKGRGGGGIENTCVCALSGKVVDLREDSLVDYEPEVCSYFEA